MQQTDIPIPKLNKIKTSDGTLVDVSSILTNQYDDIRQASSVLPPYIGWFGFLRAAATERRIVKKQYLKQTQAKVYFNLKNGAFQEHGLGDKPTEKALEYAVELDPEVIKANADYARVEKEEEYYQAIIEALRAKLELVRSVESTRRMEQETNAE